MSQRELGEFEPGGDSEGVDRPAEEARAVAGADRAVGEVVDPDRAGVPDPTGTVEIAVTQVDYTVEGYGDGEEPIVHVFGRTPDGELEHVRVLGFDPYFYVPTADLDEEALAAEDRITGWEDGYESIRGTELTKVKGQTPRDVGQIRDRWEEHYEADILFPNRFLIDKDVSGGVAVPERRRDDGVLAVPHDEVEAVDVQADPRVHTLDIEVDDRHGFPEEGEEEIICLAGHDSYRDEYVVWLYVAPALHDDAEVPEELRGYRPIDGAGADDLDVDVRTFAAEDAMLDDYLSYVEETDADILTGWNFEDFDAPYLLDRLERVDPESGYDLSIERLSRVDEVWRSDWGGPDVKGRVVFDLLRAYRSTKFSELESYRLDAVGETELGVGKERYPGDIGDLWEDDPERLLEYNLRDVEICVELDRKQEVIAFWREVAAFVGCKLEDAPTAGDAVDMYVLHKAHGEFALPSKGQQPEGEEFEGGAVFEPVSGIKEMVSVLDLKCFSADTEVLTPEGPKDITNLEIGDDIYTLNPDTHECEVKPVVETHEYENQFGELHHISGNTHDFKVTENHRFLVSSKRGWDEQTPEDFEFEEYRDLSEAQRFAFPQHDPMPGRAPDQFHLVDEVENGSVVIYYEDDLRAFRNRMPEAVTGSLELVHGSSEVAGIQKTVGKYLIPVSTYRTHREQLDEHADQVYLKYAARHRETPRSFAMEDWLELLGWYVTEGSLDRTNERVTLHQDGDTGREAIQGLLDRMGLNYSTDHRGVNVSNQYLVDWFEEHCGKGYEQKRLPDWVFELDGELLKVLLDTMIRGDGSRTESGLGKFWTKSANLKDGIVDLAVRCGHKPTVSKQSDDTWYVSIGKRGSFNKSTNAAVEAHEGDVYCITAADNHVVLAGRNGHFQWVGQSLYPMCMRTINASPETKVGEDYEGEVYEAPNGTLFRKDPDGIMREMIAELLDEREEKKARRNEHDPGSDAYELYDRQQQAVKVIMNSLYGVSGWTRFRLYDKDAASAVTATGREVIEFTETVANRLNYQVTYGDTDSVMLALGGDVTIEEAIERSFELEERINESYAEFAGRLNAEEHFFQIEFEKLYRRFFQAGKKKRYAGHIVWSEGKEVDDVDVTGFEYKRSDIAPVTKEVQHRVLEMIVEGEELADVKAYLNGVIEDFLDGEYGPEEIGIPGGIGKHLDEYDADTAQVRGAKYANLLLGTNFQRGSKPKRLYLESVHPDFFERFEAEHPELFPDGDGLDDNGGLSVAQRRAKALYNEFRAEPDVICFEYEDQLPPEFVVDYEKMLEKTLKGPIARILEALDVSWEEVKTGQEQTGLGQYM